MGLRQAHAGTGLKLDDGSRVAVVGGGPAGSFFSYFLLRTARKIGVEVEVDLYEPRNYSLPGPGGCNMCGGVVSESLLQRLAADGITLPASVIQKRIDSYILHMDVGVVRIDASRQEKRIAAVYRGAGPRGLSAPESSSFDGFLLDLATQQGARCLAKRVRTIDWEGDRPRIGTGDGEARTYDLVAGAVGVNSPAVKLFAKLGLEYRPPETTKTYISEFLLGKEMVRRYLGRSMHVFLLNIPRLQFAAIIPKNRFATVCLLGNRIDRGLVDAFLGSEEVRRCMPPLWRPPDRFCHCSPRINVGAAVRPFGDRVVLVGDSAATRLYKDGIGAAYRTAKAAAMTALVAGVSARAFQRHYWPTCRGIVRDNRLGKLLFSLTEQVQKGRATRRGIWRMVSREQKTSNGDRGMSSVLWDTFSGSADYSSVLARAMRPAFVGRLMMDVAAVGPAARRLSRRRRSTMPTLDVTGFVGKSYADGEVIYREGELGDSMFVVQAGKVEILKRDGDKEFSLAVLRRGDFFGEMAIFENEFRTTTARALGRAWVLTLNKKSFLRGIKEDPSVAFRVMQRMSKRIRELEASLVRLGTDRVRSSVEQEPAGRPTDAG